jgi:protease-4
MRKLRFASATALGGLLALVSAHTFAGQPLPPRAERVAAPGRSAASDDSSQAVVLNPANLGYLPSWELRWTGYGCFDVSQDGTHPWARAACGNAGTIATPLFLGLSTAVRFDYMQPPSAAGAVFNGDDYEWFTWALAYKLSDRASFGMSMQASASENRFLSDIFGLTAGLTYRPYPQLSLAAVAHDFNRPTVSLGGLPAPYSFPTLDQSYVLAGALRPTGRRELELAVDVRYLRGTDQFIPRASLAIDIPYVGRARGDVEIAHLPNDDRRGVIATAGLEIGLTGHASIGGGLAWGNGLGNSSNLAGFGTAAIHGYIVPGIPRSDRAVYVRIETTPGARTHMKLLRSLWAMADDRSVSGVALVLRDEPAGSYAHAEELADAIRVLRARGKKVMCSLEIGGPRALYVCANADRTVVNPAGGLRYSGLKFQYFYLKGLLDKIGVKAEILRISDHKSAPEQFTNERASDTARADKEDLLRNFEAVFTKNVAVGRKMSEDKVRASTLKGPFIAQEARDAGFVDGFAHDDQLDDVMGEMLGHKVALQKWVDEKKEAVAYGPRNRVGILLVHGDMVDGRSETIPLVNMRLLGSYTIQEQAKRMKDDPTVKAVVLRIESPGGSSMAADVMWRELHELAKKKPLIVSMGSSAASGGYYIAAAGKTIYALPLTITGSIGIFYGKADVSELLRKLGVNVETYKSAPRADAESFFRGFTDDEREALHTKILQFYDMFLERVAEGRHMTKEKVNSVGQGRVWTGQQAIELGLVDHLGGLREALAAAREAGGLPYDAPILELPPPDKTLFEQALSLAGIGRAELSALPALPAQVRDAAQALAPFIANKGDVPLARMEWVPVEGEGEPNDED